MDQEFESSHEMLSQERPYRTEWMNDSDSGNDADGESDAEEVHQNFDEVTAYEFSHSDAELAPCANINVNIEEQWKPSVEEELYYLGKSLWQEIMNPVLRSAITTSYSQIPSNSEMESVGLPKNPDEAALITENHVRNDGEDVSGIQQG